MRIPYQKAALVAPLAIFISLLLLIGRMDGGHVRQLYDRSEELEGIIRQYAVACYAQEGSYPPDLGYLVDHYGLVLDRERYVYFYDIFASNIMPDIQVVSLMEKEGGLQ